MSRITNLINEFYDEKISYDDLLEQIPELHKDKKFARLFDLIEHQPAKKGSFGVDKTKEYEENKKAVFEELNKLEKSS